MRSAPCAKYRELNYFEDMPDTSQPLRVVAAVLTFGDKVLACRRAPHKSAAGEWEFPGGKIEIGESAEAALVRELEEELGISAVIGAHINTSITDVNGLLIQLECYAATSDRIPTQSSDHDLIALYEPSAIAALDWAKPDLPVVSILALKHEDEP